MNFSSFRKYEIFLISKMHIFLSKTRIFCHFKNANFTSFRIREFFFISKTRIFLNFEKPNFSSFQKREFFFISKTRTFLHFENVNFEICVPKCYFFRSLVNPSLFWCYLYTSNTKTSLGLLASEKNMSYLVTIVYNRNKVA